MDYPELIYWAKKQGNRTGNSSRYSPRNLRGGRIEAARHNRSVGAGDNFQSYKNRRKSGPSFVCDVVSEIPGVQLVFAGDKFGQSF